MPVVAVYNVEGKKVGEMELSAEIFGIEVNKHVLHDVVVMQLANRRAGTASTKTRGLIRGGGRKPWKQKGTGRARQGSIRSPHWVGGGTVFGPHPRSYAYKLPKKVRRLAMKSALSSKVLAGEIIILDQISMEAPKTKEITKVLDNLKVDNKALFVLDQENVNVEKSARNIPGVKAITTSSINVYDILKHDKLVVTKDAITQLEEVLA